jgi:hypothetical protein
MITTYTTPSFDNLIVHRGHELSVVPEPCRLVSATVLVLEDLSTPWHCDGVTHFEAVFTGPVAEELHPDFYRVRVGDSTFALHLEPVARDVRFVHYVASLAEVAAESVLLAG